MIPAIIAQPMDRAAFEPFGTIVDYPELAGERRFFSQWLGSDAPAGAPVLHTNAVGVSTLPLQIAQVERHPNAAQVFLPLDAAQYLVTVMPSRPDGSPDHQAALSFIVPGTLGTIYRRGVWHAGITARGRNANFAVLRWRGTPEDDVFAAIPSFTVSAAVTSRPVETAQ
jgi:ureidoglycolate lyase